jgi:DnaK suppressor protein
VDDERARSLLQSERERVEALLVGLGDDQREDRLAAGETINYSDPAESLTAEGGDDAVAESLHDRLRAIERAEDRLRSGTYGRSVRSGVPLSDERLEADPAAELTVEEANAER